MNQKDYKELIKILRNDVLGLIATPKHYEFFINDLSCFFKFTEKKRKQFLKDTRAEVN